MRLLVVTRLRREGPRALLRRCQKRRRLALKVRRVSFDFLSRLFFFLFSFFSYSNFYFTYLLLHLQSSLAFVTHFSLFTRHTLASLSFSYLSRVCISLCSLTPLESSWFHASWDPSVHDSIELFFFFFSFFAFHSLTHFDSSFSLFVSWGTVVTTIQVCDALCLLPRRALGGCSPQEMLVRG
jgi:hypothetical protein